jgi:hypothetical protein
VVDLKIRGGRKEGRKEGGPQEEEAFPKCKEQKKFRTLK